MRLLFQMLLVFPVCCLKCRYCVQTVASNVTTVARLSLQSYCRFQTGASDVGLVLRLLPQLLLRFPELSPHALLLLFPRLPIPDAAIHGRSPLMLLLCVGQVEGMSSAELQQELLARGANIQGLTKIELQDMLWAALQSEAGLLPPQDQEPGVSCPLTMMLYTVP